MKTLFIYLLQVIAASGILYAYYHFVLRNKKFHQYNRYYILAAIIISLVLPLFTIPVYFSPEQTAASPVLRSLTGTIDPTVPLQTVSVTKQVLTAESSWFTLTNIIWLFYGLLAGMALARLLFSLLRIRRMVRNNQVEKLDKIRFVNTNDPATPFSFFRWLFWNRRIDLNSVEGGQVFRHEYYHIRERHSLDILLLEFLHVIFWFNPFFHLFKREIKAIHEFLADQFAMKEISEINAEQAKWKYAELLLKQALRTEHRLVNPFFHNQIKRRITMITTSAKPGYQYLRKIMVLPIAIIVIAICSLSFKVKTSDFNWNKIASHLSDTTIEPGYHGDIVVTKDGDKKVYIGNAIIIGNIEAKDTTEPFENIIVYIDGKFRKDLSSLKDLNKQIDPSTIESMSIYKQPYAEQKFGIKGKKTVVDIKTKANSTNKISFSTEIKSDTVKPTIDDNKIFDKVEIEPSFPGGVEKWREYLNKNINPTIPVDSGAPKGKYTVVVQFIVRKDGNITGIRTLTNHGYGMEEEAMRVIKMGPQWIPAKQNGHIVTAYRKQPITFEISEDPKTEKNAEPSYPSITLSQLKKSDPYKLLQLDRSVEIIDYEFSIDLPNGDISYSVNEGNVFNEKTRSLIANATTGNMITIDRIRIRSEGGSKKIPAKVYEVVKDKPATSKKKSGK